MKKPEIPFGFQDILPFEAEQRRRLENKFRQIFTSFGYGEVITPAVEYFDILTAQSGQEFASEMIKLVTNGQLLALKPEMTTPIARLTAERLANQPEPLRLFYLANVFRDEPPEQGQKREFLQAGAELIGEASLLAEVEVLILLTELLKASGLSFWRLGLNEPNFLRLNLEAVNLTTGQTEKTLQALVQKSLVGYEQQISALNISQESKDKLSQIPYLKGKPEELLARAKKIAVAEAALAPLKKLSQLCSLLKEFGIDNIELDFSLVKNLAYYTGVIFEVYAAGVGLPLGSGGRYDRLLNVFNLNKPAIGFAINFDRLELALTNQSVLQPRQNKQYFIFSQKPQAKLLKTALELQRKKVSYHLCYQALSQNEAKKQAKLLGCNFLLEVTSSGTKETPVNLKGAKVGQF